MDEQTTDNSPQTAEPQEPIAAWYVGAGQGAFWPGVPQTNLTVSQWEALELSLRQMLLAQKLYALTEA